MYKYLSLAFFLCLTLIGSAQNGKIINKDFIIDTYSSVEFNLYGETVYEKWEADYVLVETTVKVWDTPRRLFLNYVNKGRYFCELKGNTDTAKIGSVPVERNKLTARESVVSVVYYPSSFTLNDSKITRAEAAVTSTNEKDKEERNP